MDVDPDRIEKVTARIPLAWGRYLSCEKGWYQLIVDLDDALAAIDPDYELHQCKQKFGGLRYYAEPSEGLDDEKRAQFRTLIDKAEEKSFTICEDCGEPGTTSTVHHYVVTLCPEDLAKHNAVYEEWQRQREKEETDLP